MTLIAVLGLTLLAPALSVGAAPGGVGEPAAIAAAANKPDHANKDKGNGGGPDNPG